MEHEPEIDLPRLERKYVLMYLLDRLESLDRHQVQLLAEVLLKDSENGGPRPLTAVCHDANLKNGFSRDPFLRRVALSYSAVEMNKRYTSAVENPSDPPSPVDALAGSGPPRPVLKDLYSLQSLGSAYVVAHEASTRKVGTGSAGLAPQPGELKVSETFLLTNRGKAHADALRAIFDHIDWGNDDHIVVVDRSGASLQSLKSH